MMYGFFFFFVLILVVVSNPLMIVPVSILGVMLVRYVLKVARMSSDLRRVTSICLSPLISSISEVIEGRTVVKEYGYSKNVNKKVYDGLDRLSTAYVHERLIMSYFYCKIDILISGLIFLVAMSIALSKITGFFFYSKLIFALTLTNVYMISDIVVIFMYFLSELSSILSSTERIIEISKPKEVEANWNDPKPPKNWPENGSIQVENIKFRYRPELDLVLKGISFKVEDGERIGLVGRTGSGKSSLILALMRMLEIDKNENSFIKIDNLKIQDIGLHSLRKAITLIP